MCRPGIPETRRRTLKKEKGEDMSLSIVVMGASGRMGTTIANLAKEQGLTLAAVLERPEKLDALAHWGCLA